MLYNEKGKVFKYKIIKLFLVSQEEMMKAGERLKIILKNGYIYRGEVMGKDSDFLKMEDCKAGIVSIRLTEIAVMEEWV